MTMRRALPLLIAALAIQLALTLPGAAMRPTPELPLLLLALVLGGGMARLPVAAALTLLAVQKLADLGMVAALGRPFNIAADLPLLDAAVRLLAGSFGGLAGLGAVLAAALAALGIGGALWWATGLWTRPATGRRAGIALAAAVGLALLPAMTPRLENLRYASQRAGLAAATVAALRDFRAAAAQDPMAERPGLLGAIDRDVLVIFVESYGRASFATPLYAETHRATLRRAEADLARAGLAMRSGYLVSPTQGGQSWLAHATFASGLWIGDQALYQAMLASGRQGLFHHARRAGFRTAAVMPAITRPWPEAAQMGFDRILAAPDLGYRGPPFNWVTMPDQFTLAAADRLLRGQDGAPLFAQVALISSHAPWVPVPRLIGWDEVGDGSAFAAMAAAGESPQEVWRDRDNIRRHYRDAIDYALQTVIAYALRHADEPPLILVLGDHEAAQGIAPDGGRDVPMHVIGPAALVERSAAWGFAPGLVPPPDSAAIPMDRMRDLILQGFAAPGIAPMERPAAQGRSSPSPTTTRTEVPS
ncbi:sulfatase-like hydrolase/transferase [Paracoccus sp. PS-1]|uniref:sulfatase-like hydrolase/transferase n=1 Tax=unclassified Paracoccus (in: a-proteobacteria) TaxID=2688777 RepID=UPI00048C20FF|nr:MULTISPECIES: sulfatase-like hydrolase/transferase [unclassified Paracoccus (in: a-proteobacteria)]MDQ7260869.1 sulfatase-like hydrolase/transferase [Paracoccus sp. PS1]